MKSGSEPIKKSIVVFVLASIMVIAYRSEIGQSASGIKSGEQIWTEATGKPVVDGTAVERARGSFVALAKKANPAVVNVFTTMKIKNFQGGSPFGRQFPGGPGGRGNPLEEFFGEFFKRYGGPEGSEMPDQKSLGSGFIISPKGYIVTNNHVVADADEIKVKLGEEKNKSDEFIAKIIGADPNTDLALLKIEAKRELPFLPFGDSNELEVGEWVMAVGNPFGLGHSVTVGIISAKGRDLGMQLGASYTNFLQTDAAINPGNSGGPLINVSGGVIGINAAINAAANNIGFAIPSALAKKVISDIQTKGFVERGWIGVALGADVDEKMAEHFKLGSHEGGVVVSQVFDGDPADRAGLKAYDVIVELDGKKIMTSRDLIQTVANITVGKTVTVKFYRDGTLKAAQIKIEQRKEDKLQARAKKQGRGGRDSDEDSDEETNSLGMELVPTRSERAQQMGIPGDLKGLAVIALKPNSPAQKEGLRVGDVITMVNRQPVDSLKSYMKAMKDSQKTVLIGFNREGASLLVVVPKQGEG